MAPSTPLSVAELLSRPGNWNVEASVQGWLQVSAGCLSLMSDDTNAIVPCIVVYGDDLLKILRTNHVTGLQAGVEVQYYCRVRIDGIVILTESPI